MSDAPLTPDQQETLRSISLANPLQNPDEFEFFAFVVEGKVKAIFIAAKETMQSYIVPWSSNPITVKLNSDEKNVVQLEWDYNAATREFSQPE
ncbi:MAG: hypothetical protein EB023_11855 [Flavobacteriia bacterium]|nr:hypothetical protein [Flavobacteriia bacterium]